MWNFPNFFLTLPRVIQELSKFTENDKIRLAVEEFSVEVKKQKSRWIDQQNFTVHSGKAACEDYNI